MGTKQIESIFENFQTISTDFKAEQLTSGHINKTFLVSNGGDRYILQKINTNVFKNLDVITDNIIAVAHHLQKKKYPHQILCPHLFKNGECLYDAQWRIFPFFENTTTYEQVAYDEQVFEAAKFLSEFYGFLKDLDTDKIKDSIPGFIDFNARIEKFDESLKNASEERLKSAREEINEVISQKSILDNWNAVLPEIPTRVIHADPKISNFLFDEDSKDKINALIDWDTFMQGPLLYDFGDMVRSYTNLKAEDDPSNEGPSFNADNYNALKKGFLYHLKDELVQKELDNLDLAARTVIYIQAVRFLTDYLMDDAYYAVSHPEQNLDRTKNQLNLLRELREFQEKKE